MIFTFNKNGVCTNPEIITLYRKTSYEFAILRIAQAPSGSWVFGHYYQIKNTSETAGASANHQMYTTRQHAIDSGIIYLIRVCVRFDHKADYNALKQGLINYQSKHTVKSLF